MKTLLWIQSGGGCIAVETEEQAEIDLLDEEDDSRPMMFRSRSELISTSTTQIARRPTTL
jgi:hypothetical protein